jgi:hypothetical protein
MIVISRNLHLQHDNFKFIITFNPSYPNLLMLATLYLRFC